MQQQRCKAFSGRILMMHDRTTLKGREGQLETTGFELASPSLDTQAPSGTAAVLFPLEWYYPHTRCLTDKVGFHVRLT